MDRYLPTEERPAAARAFSAISESEVQAVSQTAAECFLEIGSGAVAAARLELPRLPATRMIGDHARWDR
jgi:hypothetical protein